MHPDMLRALAQARHEDLLNGRRPRPARTRLDEHPPRFARIRGRVGRMLMWAGARVMGEQPAAPAFAHERSGSHSRFSGTSSVGSVQW